MNLLKKLAILIIFSNISIFTSNVNAEILVFGGTGELGSEIVYDLLDANCKMLEQTRNGMFASNGQMQNPPQTTS